MFYDYLAVALISIGLLGLVGDWLGTDDSDAETTDPDENPALPTDDSILTYVPDETTVTISSDSAETSTQVFAPEDRDAEPTITGTQADETFDVTDSTGVALILEGGGGDDVMTFGYGASVDGGEGRDSLTLSVQPNALLSDADVGTVDLTQTDDALSVTLAPDTPEFVHTVRGQSTQITDGTSVRIDWIDYYVSDQEQLGADAIGTRQTYTAEDATRVVRVVIGETATGQEPVINEDPTISLNRTVSSSIEVPAPIVS